MQTLTHKVVMIVDSVSPTPFALLRRANHFEYRDDDRALQEFSEYEDPIQALSDECRRVLKSISNANQSSHVSSVKESTGLRDADWSRFEDLGFSGALDEVDEEQDGGILSKPFSHQNSGLRSTPRSLNAGVSGRPTTPSWADFLSSGFADEAKINPPPLLLPPDKVLPPIDTRGRSSQSHKPRLESNRDLEPGELASITTFDLDDAFWWVWISSLAAEEPSERKAAFGRCAVVETIIRSGRWLVFEEMVKGAAPEPDPTAYIAEKKSRFGWTRRSKVSRSKSSATKQSSQQNGSLNNKTAAATVSKTSIGPDQHARIQAAAARLQERQRVQEAQQHQQERRGRTDDTVSTKTNSVFTLQPVIMSEASPAMKWASKYDKDAIREAYLSNNNTGRGVSPYESSTNGYAATQDSIKPAPPAPAPAPVQTEKPAERSLPPPPPVEPVVEPQAPVTIPATPEPEEPKLTEKAEEAASPPEAHPVNRDAGRAASPMPPPKTTTEEPRPSTVERPAPAVDADLSPNSKAKANKLHKKDHKEKETKTGGLKFFGRKNRSSKVPENAAEVINGNRNGNSIAPPTDKASRRLSGFGRKQAPVSPITPEPSQGYAVASSQASTTGEGSITPVAATHPAPYERSYEPSIEGPVSPLDSADVQDARKEFARFDQGPLEDVPAFVPESPLPREDVTPPPPPPAAPAAPSEDITPPAPRSRAEVTPPSASREELTSREESNRLAQLKGVSSPAIQDRWAQLKKNAELRAAQAGVPKPSEDSSRRYSNRSDGDDETSGEESKSQ